MKLPRKLETYRKKDLRFRSSSIVRLAIFASLCFTVGCSRTLQESSAAAKTQSNAIAQQPAVQQPTPQLPTNQQKAGKVPPPEKLITEADVKLYLSVMHEAADRVKNTKLSADDQKVVDDYQKMLKTGSVMPTMPSMPPGGFSSLAEEKAWVAQSKPALAGATANAKTMKRFNEITRPMDQVVVEERHLDWNQYWDTVNKIDFYAPKLQETERQLQGEKLS